MIIYLGITKNNSILELDDYIHFQHRVYVIRYSVDETSNLFVMYINYMYHT